MRQNGIQFLQKTVAHLAYRPSFFTPDVPLYIEATKIGRQPTPNLFTFNRPWDAVGISDSVDINTPPSFFVRSIMGKLIFKHV
jgi:hypothetical protein